MKNKIFLGLQIVTGLLLVILGLNGFLQFMPMPPPPEEMGKFMSALFQTGYIFPIISTILTIVGISYITNKFAALMAIILMPVMINAFLAHLFLNDIQGIGAAAFIVVITLLIMIKNRQKYKEIFTA